VSNVRTTAPGSGCCTGAVASGGVLSVR
jgi:hypothetical protein